jgi:hypothetical protein
VPLYGSTFSRTAWRLYGGAKGLVMWYYVQRTQFGAWPWPSDDPAHAAGAGGLRRGPFAITPPTLSFVYRIPIGTTHLRDEWQSALVYPHRPLRQVRRRPHREARGGGVAPPAWCPRASLVVDKQGARNAAECPCRRPPAPLLTPNLMQIYRGFAAIHTKSPSSTLGSHPPGALS